MVRGRVFAGAVALLLIGSCNDPNGPEQELTAAEAKWNSVGPSSYSFDVRRLCFCTTEATRAVTATVSGGALVSLVYTDSGTVADTSLFRELLTVPRLFDLLRSTMATGPVEATISYDSVLGYPVHAFFDFSKAIADEEFGVEVLELRHP